MAFKLRNTKAAWAPLAGMLIAHSIIPVCAFAQESIERDVARAVIIELVTPNPSIPGSPKVLERRPGTPFVVRRIALDPRHFAPNIAANGQRTGEITWKSERPSALSGAIIAGMQNPRSVSIDGDSTRAIASFQVIRTDAAALSCTRYRVGERGPSDPGLERCRFRDFETMIALSAPEVRGDTANVEMHLRVNPGRDDMAPGGFSTWTEQFTLVRQNSAWKVIARRVVGPVIN